MDGQGRSWEVLPIKEVRIAVQVQDAAGNPLSGYRFAVADPKVGNLTRISKDQCWRQRLLASPEIGVRHSEHRGKCSERRGFSSLSTVHGSEFDTTPSPRI